MAEYLTRTEETAVRRLLDELSHTLGYISEGKEAFFNGRGKTHAGGFYVDRLWYSQFGAERLPAIGFEIERSVPLNERLRKDILNLAWSRVPLGYIVVPHRRILADRRTKKGDTAESWYSKSFKKTFEEYQRPFSFYCEIRLLDVDVLLE